MRKVGIFCICLTLLTPALINAQLRALPKDLRDAFRQARISVQNPVAARNFSVPTLDGANQTLSALKGKVVFLNFWATWCGPCRVEMPSMEILYQRFKDSDFVMLAVDIQENREEVSAFMRNMGLSFPVGLDLNGKASSLYNISAVPTSYIIDRDGYIVAAVRGSINWNRPEVFSAFEKLIAYKG
jgi:thiol-disulfide isomerase/thioredoxin